MKKYQLSYLPLFEQDLLEILQYISNELANPEAANGFLDRLEQAILKRVENPLAFEKYPSLRKRKYPYYRIYIGNYTVFYVVIDNVVEMRRLLYSPRNHATILDQ